MMTNPAANEQLKRAVLLQRLKERAMGARSSSRIARVDRTQSLPLSWPQQRLWFLDQFDHAAGVAYHLPAALKLSGPLDHAALLAALDRVVARHEILRTRFISIDGKPEQVIDAPDIGFDLREHDLRASATDVVAREACALRMIETALNAPFDLATGPLIRGLLLRTDDDM